MAAIAPKCEYFRQLVRADQKRQVNERLEALLLEGLESGSATPISDKDWQDISQAVISLH